MNRITRIVRADGCNTRLDAFVSQASGLTRSRVQTLIAGGYVLLNGQVPPKAGVSLREGDCVEWTVPEVTSPTAMPQEIPLSVLYQDSDIIVVDKPRGMVVHPSAGHADGTLVNALLAECGDLSGIGGELRPGIVHRLDMDTTGLLVAAKNDAAHNGLSAQLKERTAGRVYLALVRGELNGEGIVSQPIGRHPRDRKRMAVVSGGRDAITYWRAVRANSGATLIRLKLGTGRTHQIRVHMAHCGHPVIGDPIYGVKNDRAPVLMLHAFRLLFTHPRTGEVMDFQTSPPEDFCEVIIRRGFRREDWADA